MSNNPNFNLKDKHISKTFQNILQATGSQGSIYNLQGDRITKLNIHGTLSTTGSEGFIDIADAGRSVSGTKLHNRGGALYWGDTRLGATSGEVSASTIYEDPNPRLSADLELNNQAITGSGLIDIYGTGSFSYSTGDKVSIGADQYRSSTGLVPTGNALLEIFGDDSKDFLLIKSGSVKAASINSQGLLLLGGFTNNNTPDVEEGGLYYNSEENSFFVGL